MKPTVSVHMVTYNHALYIAQAIEGVLMQQTTFEVELVIGEDCSKDNTLAICESYRAKYPDKIKLIKRENNIGSMKNFADLFTYCTGKYIAICDGDDYWTDPNKLQDQVDFLEANPDYIIHSCNAIYVSDTKANGKLISDRPIDATIPFADLLYQNPLITCTAMFRNIPLEFPLYVNKLKFGDWFLYIILMKKSGLKAFLTAKAYAAYRIHEHGIMSVMSRRDSYKTLISQYIYMHKYLNKKFDPNTINALNISSLKKYQIELSQRNYSSAFLTLITNLTHSKLKTPFKEYVQSTFDYIKAVLASRTPFNKKAFTK